MNWIKELVLAEQQMEEAGVVDMEAGFDPVRQVEEATLDFIADLKTSFVETSGAFNQLKGSTHGNIRIYGISKTKADFMLFRNGYKLIFSMRQPGLISVSHSSAGAHYIPGQTKPEEGPSQDLLKASWGAFGQLIWTYNDHEIKIDYLVRYYMSRFVKDSAR
ncbi:MAG TPA: hypothetical protein PKC28_04485 [Bdellovibrionales bacterium]|nr:hypothetical protein [Bdellovibrionales bacterium]